MQVIPEEINVGSKPIYENLMLAQWACLRPARSQAKGRTGPLRTLPVHI